MSASICVDLGACAYDIVEDEPDGDLCPYWRDCFGEAMPLFDESQGMWVNGWRVLLAGHGDPE